MAALDIRQTDTGTITKKDFSVDPVALDKASPEGKTYWDNPNYNTYWGYYKEIPEYKTAIQAYATWVNGKGWTSDNRTTAILEGIDGWGEDSFQSIIWNLLVTKKVQGDAYAQIVRNDKTGTLLNLIPTGQLCHVTNSKGRIIGYEDRTSNPIQKFTPQEILHLCNDRIGNEIHGTSITEGVLNTIDIRNEAVADKRKQLHLSTIRIIEVDEDDTTRLVNLKKDYAEAIKEGVVLFLPKGTGDIQDLVPPTTEHIQWIQYQENFFYQALGVPKAVLGGGQTIEGDAKVSYLSYEQVYVREIEGVKADLWNQLAIRVEFSPPASLKDKVVDNDIKNTNQTGFQPNDTEAGVGE